jgi:hypothetical protein
MRGCTAFEWSIASLDRIGTRALHGRPDSAVSTLTSALMPQSSEKDFAAILRS